MPEWISPNQATCIEPPGTENSSSRSSLGGEGVLAHLRRDEIPCSLSCVAENVSSLASTRQIAGNQPFAAWATLLAFQAYDVIFRTSLAAVMSNPPKAKSQLDHSSLGRSVQWKVAIDDGKFGGGEDLIEFEREDNRALDLLKRDPIIDLTSWTRYG